MSHIKIAEIKDLPDLEKDKAILRGIMGEELEAITLYEQMMLATKNKRIKDALKDIIEDEQEHFNKARSVLILISPEEDEEEEDKDEDEVE